MGITSWWKRMTQRKDDRAIEREIERENETLDEQRYSSGDVTGLESDQRAAESVSLRSETVEDAERLAEGDD